MSTLDRVVGTAVTLLSVGAAVMMLHYTWTQATLQKKRNAKRNNEDSYIKYITTLLDPYIRTHTHAPSPSPHSSLMHPKAAYLRHQGSCMCMRVQFSIHAPSILHALEVTPNKFRYPRLVVEREDFQLLCDESLLSLYTLENEEGECIGAYSFCSNCGMHICYTFPAPAQPLYPPPMPSSVATHTHAAALCVHVNVDCIDKETVQELHITHHNMADEDTYAPNASHTKYIYAREHHAYSPPLHTSPSYIPYADMQNDADAQQSESTEDMYYGGSSSHAAVNATYHSPTRSKPAPHSLQSSPTHTHTHTHTAMYPPNIPVSPREDDGMFAFKYPSSSEYGSLLSDDVHNLHASLPYKAGEFAYQRRMSDDGVGCVDASQCVCDADLLITVHNRLSKHLSKHI